MEDETEIFSVLYIQDGVVLQNNSLNNKNLDILNNLGTLSVVDYKNHLGKCIEWNPCDVSIEGDDQEWAIVRESKCEIGNSNGNSKSSRNSVIQIQLKNLSDFKISKKRPSLTFNEKKEMRSTTFYFQLGQINRFVDFIRTILNTYVSKRDIEWHIVRDQKEVQILEKSFAELDLFSDDNTRSDAVWSFFKKWQGNPYETTLYMFSRVTDALLYKPPSQEIDSVTDILNRSFTSDELSDFHGRISSEDYELITKDPPLPPRTFPLRRSPLKLSEWSSYMDDQGRITDPAAIKDIIFHGSVSSELKSEVWKFLLKYYPWNSTFEERIIISKKKREEYYTMKLQWKTMTSTQENNFAFFKERKSLIEKDVCRTDRNMPFFAGSHNSNLETMQNILMTYVMYNFDLGYVQGMSDLLSPLLVQLGDEVDSFWCFAGFMNKVCHNFDMDQAGMKEQLQQLYCLLCFIEPELASYLEHQESNNMSFCFRWLLILFKREFSFEDIYTLWEALWTEAVCKNFHLLISAAILDTEKETIMSNNFGFTEILKHVNELANRINVELILRKAEGIYYQLSAASKIPPAIREIVGLPPLPEEKIEINKEKKVEEDASENDKNQMVDQSVPYLSVGSNELAFDNSISLQYL